MLRGDRDGTADGADDADAPGGGGGIAGAPEGGDGASEVLLINTGGHEGLEAQMRRYLRAGHLRKWEQGRRRLWYNGQWEVGEVVSEAKKIAAARMGLVHTRDAGL